MLRVLPGAHPVAQLYFHPVQFQARGQVQLQSFPRPLVWLFFVVHALPGE